MRVINETASSRANREPETRNSVPRIYTDPMNIAFLGLGNMGSHMARNLHRAGHTVTVWNRTLAKAEALQADGIGAANSVAEAAHGADIVITMLSDDHAVLRPSSDQRGVAEHARRAAPFTFP